MKGTVTELALGKRRLTVYQPPSGKIAAENGSMAYLLAGEDFAANLPKLRRCWNPHLTGNSLPFFWCWRRHLTGMLILPPGLRRGCLAGRRISGVVHRSFWIFWLQKLNQLSDRHLASGLCRNGRRCWVIHSAVWQQPFRFLRPAPSAGLGAFPGRFGTRAF